MEAREQIGFLRVLEACGLEEFESFNPKILELEEALEITVREFQS